MNRTHSIKSWHRNAVVIAALLLHPALHAHAQTAGNAARLPHAAAQAPAHAQNSAAPQPVVELNTASMQDLTKLPGIGPVRAQAILDLRTRMGGFKKVDDIMRVKGIGRKTFRKLEPMLRVQAGAPHASSASVH
jgi:comEA protein